MAYNSEYHKTWRTMHRERLRIKDKLYRQKNRHNISAKRRTYRQQPRVKDRRYAKHLWVKYNITPEQVDNMLYMQDGVCAICKLSEPRSRNNRWHVDHDHTTKTLRGVLCYPCNAALGYAKDNLAILRAMISYLQQAPSDMG